MEFVLYLFAIVGVFVIYFVIADFISNRFSNARGIDKLFWFFILMVTFSWLFGKSDSSNTQSNYYDSEDSNDYLSDDYDSCSWDNESSSWDCDDD